MEPRSQRCSFRMVIGVHETHDDPKGMFYPTNPTWDDDVLGLNHQLDHYINSPELQ